MFNYQSLTKPTSSGIYLKVPARSRKQDFALYKITDEPQTNLDVVDKNFDFRYLTLQKNSLTLILIPFENEIRSDQFENLEFEFLNDNFSKYMYGHSYRDRSSNIVPFELHHPKSDYVNAMKFVQDQQMYFDTEKIKEALAEYVKTEEFKDISIDPLKTRTFLHSLANDVYNSIYTQTDLDLILGILRPHIKKIGKEYKTAYSEIDQSSELRARTKPFGQYLKLYRTNHGQAKNIAQQMLSMMASDFEPNPKLDLSIAADLISQIYPPALIEGGGHDRDNVVIFNPLEGIWIHNEDLFYSLLTAIRPYSKQNELTTMIATFAAQARNKDSFIKPYNQSRYLPFKNIVLDVKTKLTYPLDHDLVKKLHFIERTQINLKYDPEVIAAPEFPGKLNNRNKNGNFTWDPWTFFMAYADNDPKKLNFFMFCLSLGLFSGHNFGVHVNIKGESRWGKTIISEVFKGLFPGKVFTKAFSTLNEQFGFTSYDPATSVIWIDECNSDAAPLNNEYGIQVYDSLANNQAHLQVKSKGDLQLNNPPQMFIDGTSFVKAKDMDTGPAGRTLVYKLPMEDDSKNSITELIHQAYAKDIIELLQDEAVLQFLVNMMIEAYRTCLKLTSDNYDRLWSLKLNLGGHSSDTTLLPEFARDWRQEMAKTQGGDIQEWFEYDFMPYFSTDPNTPTKMHNALAYLFYANDYKTKYSRQDPHNQFMLAERNFSNQFKNLLKENGWERSEVREANGRKTRQSNKYLSKLNFAEQAYKDDGHQIPIEFTKENIDSDRPLSSYPLGMKVTGWYKIIKIKQ